MAHMARRLVVLALPALLAAPAFALSACGLGGIDPIVKAIEDGTDDDNGPPGAEMSGLERSYAQQVLALVNQERTTRGLDPVAWSEPATAAAYAHAVDMDQRNFFDHVNPDGEDPSKRLLDAGV